MEHDERGALNVGLLRKAGELGLLGVTMPEADGGAGLDPVASVIVHEELAYADPGFALGVPRARAVVRQQLLLGQQPGAAREATCPRRSRPDHRRDGHDRAGGRHRRARHADHRAARRRPLRAERPQDVHHQRAPRPTCFLRLRQARRAHHDVRRRAQHARLRDRRQDPQDGHARVDDERADVRRVPAAGGQPARPRGRRHHQHDAQPRDRATRPGRDERSASGSAASTSWCATARSAARSASRSPSTARSSATSARATRS
jgi:hypothetical protein